MKIRLLVTLAGLAFGFALPTFAQEQNAVDPQVRQQIEAILMKFEEAYNKYDAAAMAALHAQDAVEVRAWVSAGWVGFRAASHREKVCSRLCIKSSQDGQRACSGICDRQRHMRDNGYDCRSMEGPRSNDLCS